MKDRIRFISHKGKKILLIDATNFSPEELVELLPLALSRNKSRHAAAHPQ
jgi:hypothetical protein